MGRFTNAPGHFLNMVQRDANEILPRILGVAKKAKQIWVRGQMVSTGNPNDWPLLIQYIEKELSDVWEMLNEGNRYELHQI
jgi:hypothetical protein